MTYSQGDVHRVRGIGPDALVSVYWLFGAYSTTTARNLERITPADLAA